MSKNRLDFQSHLSRHDHDTTAGYTSSLTTGPIVPQYFDILGPGDSVYYRTHAFARLQDLTTAFLGQVDIHVDYYFVPLQMIFTGFGNVFSQTNDYISRSVTPAGTDRFPLIAFNNNYNTGDVTYNNPSIYKLFNIEPTDHYYGHVDCCGKEFARLFNALDVNPLGAIGCSPDVDTTLLPVKDGYYPINANLCENPKLISPWLFCAYQAIYQKFYRNEEFEQFDIRSYNVDSQQIDSIAYDGFFKLRYCQRPSDYFTSLRVSPIASAVNSLRITPSGDVAKFPNNGALLGSLLNKVNDYLGFDNGNYTYQNNENIPFAGQSFDSAVLSFNATSVGHDVTWQPTAANIRTLFAVDKFLRIYGRAGKTYDDQILAHFGFDVPHDVKHNATRLARYHFSLQADPVFASSSVASENPDLAVYGSQLGQVGGQSSNSLDTDQEKFTAPVHGVFMAVAYAVSKPRYFGTFSKLHGLATRLDFPIPEFDKLGAQPFFNYQLDPEEFAADGGDMSHFFGWQNRYQEFKRKYNRISLNYAHYSDFAAIPPRENLFAPWVLSRRPFFLNNQATGLVNGTQLFERPDALNPVMAKQYDTEWSEDYYYHPHLILQSDPIIFEFECFAKKVSWMSESGEPDL